MAKIIQYHVMRSKSLSGLNSKIARYFLGIISNSSSQEGAAVPMNRFQIYLICYLSRSFECILFQELFFVWFSIMSNQKYMRQWGSWYHWEPIAINDKSWFLNGFRTADAWITAEPNPIRNAQFQRQMSREYEFIISI